MRSIFQKLFSAAAPRKSPRKKGQTLVEYALILALLAIIMLTAMSLLGKQIIAVFSEITTLLDTAQGSH
jgi:Flp pilus assembly pilin Flp